MYIQFLQNYGLLGAEAAELEAAAEAKRASGELMAIDSLDCMAGSSEFPICCVSAG